MIAPLLRRLSTGGLAVAGPAVAALAVVGLAMVLSGCAGQTEAPARLYALHPIATADAVAVPQRTRRSPWIGIHRVVVPGYVDRPEVVTRGPGNALVVDPKERWAESLPIGLTRLLLDNLSVLLGSDQVILLPEPSGLPVDLEVMVDLTQFELDGLGSAVLAGRWTVTSARTLRDVQSAAFDLHEPIVPEGYEAGVAALNRSVSAVSRDIALAIGRVGAGTRGRVGRSR